MVNEVALNLMRGIDGSLFTAFMVSRSDGYDSGNWSDLRLCLTRVLKDNQRTGRIGYYIGRPFVPIAGVALIRWSDQ